MTNVGCRLPIADCRLIPKFEETKGDWVVRPVFRETECAMVKSPLPGGEDLGEGKRQNKLQNGFIARPHTA
jgi:hypothetical protein